MHGPINIKLLLLHLVSCFYYCINDARSHKHLIQKYRNETICDGWTERKLVLYFVIILFVYDVSASVEALQFVFSNSSYELMQMRGLTDFGARLGGASVIETAILLGVSRAPVSKVVTAYKIHGKASSAARNGGQKPKLSEKDRRTLNRIVTKNHRTTAAKGDRGSTVVKVLCYKSEDGVIGIFH